MALETLPGLEQMLLMPLKRIPNPYLGRELELGEHLGGLM